MSFVFTEHKDAQKEGHIEKDGGDHEHPHRTKERSNDTWICQYDTFVICVVWVTEFAVLAGEIE